MKKKNQRYFGKQYVEEPPQLVITYGVGVKIEK